MPIGNGIGLALRTFPIRRGAATPIPPAPLNSYTAGAKGFWSIPRRLLGSYVGPLIRVRRASDNVELDIGFDVNGDLDTAAILTFCGVGVGQIAVVYDQSGSGQDMVQAVAAAQPYLCNSGAVFVNDKGFPIGWQFGAESFACVFNEPLAWPFSFFGNNSAFLGAAARYLMSFEGINHWFGKDASDIYLAFGGVTSTFSALAVNQTTAYVFAVAAGADSVSVDAAVPEIGGDGDDATTSAGVQWGDAYGGGANWNNFLCEMVLYDTDKSVDIVAISTALLMP